MNTPEKIYLQEPTKVRTQKMYDNDIEYTRTDAFIEKVARFLENKLYDRVEIQVWGTRAPWGTIIPSLTTKKAFIEDIIKYMKGE